MKWFVYMEAGDCNFGDHFVDLKDCDTEAEAMSVRDEFILERGSEAIVAVIRGYYVVGFNEILINATPLSVVVNGEEV